MGVYKKSSPLKKSIIKATNIVVSILETFFSELVHDFSLVISSFFENNVEMVLV